MTTLNKLSFVVFFFLYRSDDFNNHEERPQNRPHTFKDNSNKSRGGFNRANDYNSKSSEERDGAGSGGGGFRDRRTDGGGQRQQGGFRERRERGNNNDFDGRNNVRR